jgi:UDP-N-acetylglucosamine 2-epimerase (non-hydrolysing)
MRLEKLIMTQFKPDAMIVVGDVNSTLAASITANKLGIFLAHVESGLRSNDRTMPEEINRLLTDEIADCFFVTEPSGMDNLKKDGKAENKIHFVGNTMIDTLVAFQSEIKESNVLDVYSLEHNKYVLMTMHRPATVDSKEGLLKLLELIEFVTVNYKVLFPIHPRTLNNLSSFGLIERFNANKKIITTQPLDYFSFQKLISSSKFILTDSGGIQEESTFLKVPCLTLRPNTERPITCSVGTNTLVPFDLSVIKNLVESIENENYKKGEIPLLWDGNATKRILEILSNVNLKVN